MARERRTKTASYRSMRCFEVRAAVICHQGQDQRVILSARPHRLAGSQCSGAKNASSKDELSGGRPLSSRLGGCQVVSVIRTESASNPTPGLSPRPGSRGTHCTRARNPTHWRIRRPVAWSTDPITTRDHGSNVVVTLPSACTHLAHSDSGNSSAVFVFAHGRLAAIGAHAFIGQERLIPSSRQNSAGMRC